MPKIRVHLQSPDNQFINAKYTPFKQETQVLKLSNTLFEIVKHTV